MDYIDGYMSANNAFTRKKMEKFLFRLNNRTVVCSVLITYV